MEENEHPRNILIAVPDLARDPGLLCGTLLLGVDATGQAERSQTVETKAGGLRDVGLLTPGQGMPGA